MPPLKVFDPLWSNYITPQWPPNASLEGRLGIEYGTDNWGLIPSVPPMLVQQGENGRRVMVKGKGLAGDTTNYDWFANVWNADVFAPDHYAEVSHNPPVGTDTEVKDCGPSVRQDPNSDSCYCMSLWYDSPGAPHPNIAISRIKNGVKTLIGSATYSIPQYTHMQDWWYMQLQVWGQNPVKLRVVTKAPTIFVSGSEDFGNLLGIMTYAFPNEWGTDTFTQFIEDPENPNSFIPSEYWLGNSRGAWAEYGIAPDNEDGINPIGQNSPYHAWVVWEGEDSSSDRLLTGQPGIRGIPNGTTALYTSHGLADFTAGDLYDRFTIRQTSSSPITIGGYKATGTTVSIVELPAADITQTLEGTEWELVTGYLGATLTATDGTDTLEIVVPALELTATPAAGTYASAQSVTLTCNDNTAIIYYTLDGSDPRTALVLDYGTDPPTCVMDKGVPITNGLETP